jgi:hypothetical protein
VSSCSEGPVMSNTYEILFANALGADAKLPSVLMAPLIQRGIEKHGVSM